MGLTSELFATLQKFDNERRERREEYFSWIEGHKRYTGSSGYSADRAAAEKRRKAGDAAAADAAAKKINETLQAMRANIAKLSFRAPTEEELRTLQVLNLMTTATKAEIEAVAETMSGSYLSLAALNCIANRFFNSEQREPGNRHHEDYRLRSKEMTPETAEKILSGVIREANEILKSPVTAPTLSNAEMQRRIHGKQFSVDNLPQREPLLSEREFYRSCVPAESLDVFLKGVDGER